MHSLLSKIRHLTYPLKQKACYANDSYVKYIPFKDKVCDTSKSKAFLEVQGLG